MNEFLDIGVYLTTSEFANPDTSSASSEDELLSTIEGNLEFNALKVPIIHVEFQLPSEFKSEFSEHEAAMDCLNMSKEVEIDLKNHTVTIAGDLNDESTYLLSYQGSNLNEFEIAFFNRYAQTNGFAFNFVVFNRYQVRFVIRGIYLNEKWKTKEILPSSNIRAVPK